MTRTIIVCPVQSKGTKKCRSAQCHLRHDVVYCKPCKCFVLHDKLAKHRRGEDHRLKCGFGGWKAYAMRPARAILPSPYPYAPKPKPSKIGYVLPASKPSKDGLKKRNENKPSKKHARKLARMEGPAGAGGVPARGGEAGHLSVSGEEGLDFKSDIRVGKKKTKKATNGIPVIIQKTADNESVSLTLVGVEVTGAGSEGFLATASLPIKIKGNNQRTIPVSFVPTAPGEWDARLEMRFLHVSLGQRVTLSITRRLHGVATSSVNKPQAPQSPGVGDRASQKPSGSNKNIQQRGTGTRQRGDTGRDSPKSY